MQVCSGPCVDTLQPAGHWNAMDVASSAILGASSQRVRVTASRKRSGYFKGESRFLAFAVPAHVGLFPCGSGDGGGRSKANAVRRKNMRGKCVFYFRLSEIQRVF